MDGEVTDWVRRMDRRGEQAEEETMRERRGGEERKVDIHTYKRVSQR